MKPLLQKCLPAPSRTNFPIDINKIVFVTFIIPVLNGEKYIRHCLDSILTESSDQDEIIVVDNGSTDTTASIVMDYGNIKLRIFPDVTVSALRNRGAELAVNELPLLILTVSYAQAGVPRSFVYWEIVPFMRQEHFARCRRMLVGWKKPGSLRNRIK